MSIRNFEHAKKMLTNMKLPKQAYDRLRQAVDTQPKSSGLCFGAGSA
jgi:hypothetical protein